MKKLIVAGLLVAASLYLLMSAFIQDFEVNKYKDLASVKEHKAIAEGWIPALLPPSASKIAETHERDKRSVYGVFDYKEVDEAALVKQLTPTHDANGTMEWGDFLFRVDTEKNHVMFRNKVPTANVKK